jgi:excisionase family DNA binding protein
LSLAEAGRALGISEQKLRRRITRGKIKAVRVGDAQGVEWRIPADAVLAAAPASPEETAGPLEAARPVPAEAPSPAPMAEAVAALIAELARERERSSRLEQERAELYGRLGFYQARLDALVERLALPAAPQTHVPPPQDSRSGRGWRFWRRRTH